MTRQSLRKHNRHNVNQKFNLLGIGLPRSGTGYTYMLLRNFGLDVGHERIRPDGLVDWQLALRPKTKKPFGRGSLSLFKRGLVIRNTRNPIDIIPSFIKKSVKKKLAMDFIQENINLDLRGLNDLEKCIEVMFALDNIIDSWNPDFTFKVESEANKLYNFLTKHYKDLRPFDAKYAEKIKFYNKYYYTKRWAAEIADQRKFLKSNYLEKLNSMCRKHGYPSLPITTRKRRSKKPVGRVKKFLQTLCLFTSTVK